MGVFRFEEGSAKHPFFTLPENSLIVFGLIHQFGPISKTDLCNILQKKMTPINRMLQPLELHNFVIVHSKGDSTGGRKPMLYDINPHQHYLLGINFSTTYCEVALVNLRLETLAIERFQVDVATHPDSVVEKASALCYRFVQSENISMHQVLGVGVSVFSSFNESTGFICRPIKLYAHERWVEYPILQEVQKRIPLPVHIEKGTNAAALLEYVHGKGMHSKKMFYLLCAMNIRSAMLFDGKLINTAPNYEDAFGHMTIDYDGDRCDCGWYGCVAAYATIPAVVKAFLTGLKMGRTSSVQKPIETITFPDICDAVHTGDLLAREVIERSASMLGLALANYINLFAPELIILSGLIPQNCPLYYEIAVETAKKKVELLQVPTNIRFEQNGMYSTPITIGAAALILDQAFHLRPPLDYKSIDL